MDEDWERIHAAKPEARIKPLVRRWTVAAAAIALLIIAGVVYQTLLSPFPRQIEVTNDTLDRREIQLADGSTVWLNRNSTLIYSEPFNDEERNVQLEGEAFFEVQSDPDRPFFVHTKAVTTKVLGTSFNVEAYAEQETIEVALVEGSVKVLYAGRDSVTLRPGQQFSYDQTSGTGSTDTFMADEPYAWKSDVIYFNKASVEEVISKLERWYDVRFEIAQDAVVELELVHRIEVKKRSLDEVLEDINEVVPDYTFERQANDLILISPKSKK